MVAGAGGGGGLAVIVGESRILYIYRLSLVWGHLVVVSVCEFGGGGGGGGEGIASEWRVGEEEERGETQQLLLVLLFLLLLGRRVLLVSQELSRERETVVSFGALSLCECV